MPGLSVRSSTLPHWNGRRSVLKYRRWRVAHPITVPYVGERRPWVGVAGEIGTMRNSFG